MPHQRHAHGPLVRLFREAAHLTLDDLARHAGISVSFLSRVERDLRRADRATTLGLARALDVRPLVLSGQLPPWGALRDKLTHVGLHDFATQIGVTPDDLDDAESGYTPMSVEMFDRIARRLGVPSADLREAVPPAYLPLGLRPAEDPPAASLSESA